MGKDVGSHPGGIGEAPSVKSGKCRASNSASSRFVLLVLLDCQLGESQKISPPRARDNTPGLEQDNGGMQRTKMVRSLWPRA
jgi:hypothetical protein